MQHFPLFEKLHTDILEERYGSIHAKVLRHDSKIRKSLLTDSKDIARTYALTFLQDWHNKEVSNINEQIKNGEAIGVAFREKGYSIRKNVLDVFIIRLPKWLKDEFYAKEGYAKARISEFYAQKKNGQPIIYGIVTEIYTPDFRKPLIRIADKEQISALTECLEKKGFSKNEIWRRIGDENNYEDCQDKYEKAKKESRKIVSKIEKKVREEIKSPD